MLTGRDEFRPWALIPAKRFGRAKRRLAPALDGERRRALARALFERVLAAAQSAHALEGVLVLTDGDDAARLAQKRGAQVLRDRGVPGLSEIVDAGAAFLRARGATHALVLMSDLPLIEPRDVRELCAHLRDHPIVIAPDFARAGTNTLGFALELELRTSFGSRDSFARHVRSAERLHMPAYPLAHPRLAFDLDSPADLALLGELPLQISASRLRASAPRARASAVNWR